MKEKYITVFKEKTTLIMTQRKHLWLKSKYCKFLKVHDYKRKAQNVPQYFSSKIV